YRRPGVVNVDQFDPWLGIDIAFLNIKRHPNLLCSLWLGNFGKKWSNGFRCAALSATVFALTQVAKPRPGEAIGLPIWPSDHRAAMVPSEYFSLLLFSLWNRVSCHVLLPFVRHRVFYDGAEPWLASTASIRGSN